MAGLKAMTLNSYISALLSFKLFKVGVNGSINAENFWIIILMFLMNKNQGRFQECLLLWRNWETEVSSWSNTIYVSYTAPLRDILPKHNVQFHRYADHDTQLYLFCESSSPIQKSIGPNYSVLHEIY